MAIPYSSPTPPAIGDLKNVNIDITTLANDDVIKFNQVTNLWENGVGGGGGGSQDLCSVLTQGDDACDLNITNLNTLQFDPLTSISTTTPLGGEMLLSTSGSGALQISNTSTIDTRSRYTLDAPMFHPVNVPPDTNVGNGVDGIYNQSLRLGTINQQPFQQNFNNAYNFPQTHERQVGNSVYLNSPNIILGQGRPNSIISPGSKLIPKFGDVNGLLDEMFYDPCNMRFKPTGLVYDLACVPEPFRSNGDIRGGHWISRFNLEGVWDTANANNRLELRVIQFRGGVLLRQFLIYVSNNADDVGATGQHRIWGWSNIIGEDIDNSNDTFSFELLNNGIHEFVLGRFAVEFEYQVPH